MRETKHLWITYNPAKGDYREIIIDEEEPLRGSGQHKDIRICDGHKVVKVRFDGTKIKDVLVNDVFVYP